MFATTSVHTCKVGVIASHTGFHTEYVAWWGKEHYLIMCDLVCHLQGHWAYWFFYAAALVLSSLIITVIICALDTFFNLLVHLSTSLKEAQIAIDGGVTLFVDCHEDGLWPKSCLAYRTLIGTLL